MKLLLKLYAACLLAGFFTFSANAQNQALADSLIAVLYTQNNLTAKERYKLYYTIAEEATHPPTVVLYSSKALELAKEKQLDVQLAQPLVLYGQGLMQQGNLVQALDTFFEAIRVYQATGNEPIGIAIVYGYIAQVYRMQNHHANAVLYYNKSIDYLRTTTDTVRLASFLLNLGYEYYKAGTPDSALAYTLEAGVLFSEIGFPQGKAYALGNTGLIHAAQGNDRLSRLNLEQAIAMLRQFNDRFAIVEYELEMANIYQQRGDLHQAIVLTEKSYGIAKENGFTEFARDAAKKLADLFALNHQFEKAYLYQSDFLKLQDSLSNRQTTQKLADLRTGFEVAQKQQEIEALQEEKEKQQLGLTALALVIVLGIILLVVLMKTAKQKQATLLLISEQKETLSQQRDQLEALNSTRNRFFSIISHDLRGPVNAFNGISRLIQHYIAANDMQQLAEVSEYIDKSARQLSSLLDNLLDWSVSQQGEFPYRAENVALKPMLTEIVEIFKPMAHAKQIQLEATLDDDLVLWADVNSVLTIIRNLTSNALKFTPEGGAVTLNAQRIAGYAEIQIRDTGIGIPEERLKSLFEVQHEKRTWGTAGEKGLGLGLKLAYEFTTMNKGTLTVNSLPDEGTTFTLRLPLHNMVAEQQEVKKSRYSQLSDTHKTLLL